jgi:hypothetical protein
MARPTRRALKGAGQEVAHDLGVVRRAVPDISNYLRQKNLWNDPGSGRFIRRGRSTAKAQAIAMLLDRRMAAVERLRNMENGRGKVRLGPAIRDMWDGPVPDGLFPGAITTAEYVDDNKVKIAVPGTLRWYEVGWNAIDPSWGESSSVPDVPPAGVRPYLPSGVPAVVEPAGDLSVQVDMSAPRPEYANQMRQRYGRL